MPAGPARGRRAQQARGRAVSIDTTRASVATAALAAGAGMVNDVSGGLADPAMGSVVADAGVPWVLVHRRGGSRDMYAEARYDDVVAEVRRELCRRVDAALAAGVAAEQIVVDPGVGFAKQPEHDLALLAGLDRITDLGFPVLVGASRTRFLGALLATDDGRPRPPDQRDDATLATSVLAARAGAWGVGRAGARRGGQRGRGPGGRGCFRRRLDGSDSGADGASQRRQTN